MQGPNRIDLEHIPVQHATDQQPVTLHSNPHPYFRSIRQRNQCHTGQQVPQLEYLTLSSTAQTAHKEHSKHKQITASNGAPNLNGYQTSLMPAKPSIKHSGILDIKAIKKAELQRNGMSTSLGSMQLTHRNKLSLSISKSRRICQQNGVQLGRIELGGHQPGNNRIIHLANQQ